MNLYGNLETLKTQPTITGLGDDTLLLAFLETASRMVDDYTQRRFFVELLTRYFTPEYGDRLRLDAGLLSVTSIKSDEDGDRTYEVTWAATDYDLHPLNAVRNQRPYTSILTAPNGARTFPANLVRSLEIVGTWGFWQDIISMTTLNEALDASETGIDVVSATNIKTGMTILVDSEQMYVESISSDTLTVKRGVNGTTAATHLTAAAVSTYSYPLPVTQAVYMQAARWYKRKDSSFGTLVGEPSMGPFEVHHGLDPDVKLLLSSYRKLVMV